MTRPHSIDREELMAFVDRELDVARAAIIRTHLTECAECRAAVAELAGVSRALEGWAIEPAPASLDRRVLDAAAVAADVEPRRGWRAWVRGPANAAAWRPAAALAAVALVTVSSVLLWRRGTEPPVSPAASVAAPSLARKDAAAVDETAPAEEARLASHPQPTSPPVRGRPDSKTIGDTFRQEAARPAEQQAAALPSPARAAAPPAVAPPAVVAPPSAAGVPTTGTVPTTTPVFGAVGAPSPGAAAKPAAAPAPPPPPPAMGEAVTQSAGRRTLGAAAAGDRGGAAANAVADRSLLQERVNTPAEPLPARRLSLVVVAADFTGARDAVERAARSAQAQVSTLAVEQAEDGGRVVAATLFVPLDRVTALMLDLRGLGRVLTDDEATDDLAPQAADLNRRRADAEAELRRLEAVVGARTDSRQRAAIEVDQARLRETLAQIDRARQAIDDRVRRATVTVQVRERPRQLAVTTTARQRFAPDRR